MSEIWQRNLAVPFFTQRDNTYVWQQLDDNNQSFGPKYPMAWRTCNITSLCMILHYWGLTKETPNQMIEKVFSKTDKDWKWLYEETVEEKNKTRKGAARLENWSDLEKVAKLYTDGKVGFKVVQGNSTLSVQLLKDQIEKGIPVIISTGLGSEFGSGDTDGHIVVVRGFTDNDDVILNDPFGIPVENDNRIRQSGDSNNIYGWYYLSNAASVGDNIIINKDDFASRYAKGTSKYLYIEGPLWQLPGGTENDSENCYPIKTSNFWHNGIHLQSSVGFYSIGSGRLIAARNAEVSNHGSSSFALVKYQMPEKQNQFFYALYMHLKKIDLAQELKNFFLENQGNLSNELKGTWYEQIFNNLLPYYKIISHKVPKQVSNSDYNKIFKANLNGLTLTHTDDPADIFSETGLLSRHAKLYLLPVKPELLKKISEIENYKNFSNLKFMVKAKDSDFTDTDGYYYFFCGNDGQKQLCCCKNEVLAGEPSYNNFATYDIKNESSYKYYADCLYQLYDEKTFIFNRITMEERNERIKKVKINELFRNSILTDFTIIDDRSRFEIGLHKKNGFDSTVIEGTYHYICREIKEICITLENIFTIFCESGVSADENELKSYFDLNNYIKMRKDSLGKLLTEITRVNKNRNSGYGEKEKITDTEWTRILLEDAENQIKMEETIKKKGNYSQLETMPSMRNEFETNLNEYAKTNLIDAIAICEFLMLEFAGIPKSRVLTNKDLFPFSDFTTGETYKLLYKLWNKYFTNLKDVYLEVYKKRYIDNYIEIPKGVKIGLGSIIPDSNKKNSIHFEIFSKDILLDKSVVISDDDENNFYDPSEITKILLDGFSISKDEKDKIIKYAADYVITKEEIKKIYTNTNIFQELVVYHQSEWKTRKYTKDDIKAITASERKLNKKNEKEVVKTLDYMNDYYGKYNWVDKKIQNELQSEKFYYYHPSYFIDKLLQISKDNLE